MKCPVWVFSDLNSMGSGDPMIVRTAQAQVKIPANCSREI